MTESLEAIELPDGAVEIRGYTLDEIWQLAHLDTVTHNGVEYVPMLSFREEGAEGAPVLYLSRDYV